MFRRTVGEEVFGMRKFGNKGRESGGNNYLVGSE